MADGDYERGRGREIAAIAARLKRLAASRPQILILNGWASSPQAWDLCAFRSRPNVRLFSYVDQLDGLPEQLLGRPIEDNRRYQGQAIGGADCPQSAYQEPETKNQEPRTKFILVGWSMGGSSALRLACRYPDRIAGLVLLAATPRMMREPESDWIGMNERRLEALRKGLEITRGEGFFGVPEGKPNPYLVDAPENLARGLKYLLENDTRADLEQVFRAAAPKFPVFIFQSARDGIVRAENAAYLKTIFPQARLTLVPGAEHALPIEIPKEIDDAVDACLAVAAQG